LRLLSSEGIFRAVERESAMTTVRRRWPAFRRIACLALAATLLSGCVIEPAWRVHPGYYYYR